MLFLPEYKVPIDMLLMEEDVRAMFNKSENAEQLVLIALHWLTGARTSEVLQLTKEDVGWDDDNLVIRLNTLKLGDNHQRFLSRQRTLTYERLSGLDTNPYIETVIRYTLKIPQGRRLLKRSTRWSNKVMNHLGKVAIGKEVTPYHFRHSTLTWLARNGATVTELMHFKGATNIKSVQPYVHAVPFLIKAQALRRTLQVKPVPKLEAGNSSGFADTGGYGDD